MLSHRFKIIYMSLAVFTRVINIVTHQHKPFLHVEKYSDSRNPPLDCQAGFLSDIFDCFTEYLNDLYMLDLPSLHWTQLITVEPPAPRALHGFTAAAGRLYVFGGQAGQG